MTFEKPSEPIGIINCQAYDSRTTLQIIPLALFRQVVPFLVKLSLGMLIACSPLIADPSAQPVQPEQVSLTILHDNDIHGHIFPFPYIEAGISPLEQQSRGGAARRATLVRQLRRSIHHPTFLVDSGDIATRGPLATTYQGIADVEALNAVGYELAAIGNNEFKLKDGVDINDSLGAQADLMDVVKRSRFPWICANATDAQGAILQGVQPYVVRDFDGVRVGFLGLTAPRSAYYPQTKGWTISDPIVAAKNWIPIARAHCDILIALTHIGTDLDERLAAQTTGLDAIIGGDSHTFLYKPVIVNNPDGYAVPIVQDGEFGVDLGRFDLTLAKASNGNWTISSYQDRLIPIGPSIKEAPDVNAVLAPFVQPFQVIVGHIATIASTPLLRLEQTNQIIVDALREQTRADIAINPGNGDASLYNVFRHTNVTRYDVFAILPFHDDVVLATLTGAQIKSLLTARPDSVTAGNITNLDDNQHYQVAMVDYIASNVYKISTGENDASTAPDVRGVVIGYFHDMPDVITR
jgi:2',3'-cyclic-nucleotide 2'-phosphodiesterase (5'-nucleotidase family)